VLADGLVAQAHAQNGLDGGVALEHPRHQPCLGWHARPGRDDDFVVAGYAVEVDPVVARHVGLGAETSDGVDYVVDKRVVVVDYQ
jgi:hypothetical protein